MSNKKRYSGTEENKKRKWDREKRERLNEVQLRTKEPCFEPLYWWYYAVCMWQDGYVMCVCLADFICLSSVLYGVFCLNRHDFVVSCLIVFEYEYILFSSLYYKHKGENPYVNTETAEERVRERERKNDWIKKAFSLPVFTLKVSEVYIRLFDKNRCTPNIGKQRVANITRNICLYYYNHIEQQRQQQRQ